MTQDNGRVRVSMECTPVAQGSGASNVVLRVYDLHALKEVFTMEDEYTQWLLSNGKEFYSGDVVSSNPFSQIEPVNEAQEGEVLKNSESSPRRPLLQGSFEWLLECLVYTDISITVTVTLPPSITGPLHVTIPQAHDSGCIEFEVRLSVCCVTLCYIMINPARR